MTAENDIITAKILPQGSEADRLNLLMPHTEEASELWVACRRADFLGSAMARAVEDCDAHLINMNVTGASTTDGRMLVHLRVNRRNPASVARSMERYGYEVVELGGSGADSGTHPVWADDDERLRLRAAELIKILEL